jgi:AAA domain, putative AbiEii toxin, Type IV TA system
VGPNGSGKSNLLRALHLFFNGEVENGVPLDLSRDFHDPTGKRKAKKQIDVELDMHFGSGLRADLQAPIAKLAGGKDTVTIRKRWSLDKVTHAPTVELAFGAAGSSVTAVSDDDAVLVERLIGSVRFRYISNHVHPTDLLRQEEENITREHAQTLGAVRDREAAARRDHGQPDEDLLDAGRRLRATADRARARAAG